jgi:hypothetical protein
MNLIAESIKGLYKPEVAHGLNQTNLEKDYYYKQRVIGSHPIAPKV